VRVLIAVGHGGIYSGGSHQSLYALAGLKKAGVDVMAVWGPDLENDCEGFDRLRSLDIPFTLAPLNKSATVRSILALRRTLREFQPDVVEAVKGQAQHHVLYASLGLPCHAVVFYRGVSRPLDVFQALKYRLPRVNRIIANCEALKRSMVETGLIRADKIDVVYGEFDPACAEPDAVNADGLREELVIPEGGPIITQLGNWAEWRGQDVTLRAAAELKKRGEKAHFLFVGRETDRLKDLVNALEIQERVTLSSYRRDPERVLKVSDAAVNASTSIESLSGALLNAQAMGLPAVASDLAGSAEIVADGETGFIVPPRDATALADALARLLAMTQDERNRMGAAARARALKLFSSEARVMKRLECYERAIWERRKA